MLVSMHNRVKLRKLHLNDKADLRLVIIYAVSELSLVTHVNVFMYSLAGDTGGCLVIIA